MGEGYVRGFRVRQRKGSKEGKQAGKQRAGVWPVSGHKKTPDTLRVRGVDSINMAATYSPALWCSTIGHEGLNYSVRYGKR